MRDAYLNRKLSLRQIAEEAGCGLRTVARWMVTHGIPSRSCSEGKVLNTPRGEDHPGWIAAQVCPRCGGRRSHGSKTCMRCKDVSGDRNPNWRGDEVNYPGIHERLKALRGSATAYVCEHCDSDARDWAYDHTDPDQKFDPDNGPFSLDLTKYMPLCKSCHRRVDAANARRRKGIAA
jgi:hypothetical protein